MIQVHQNTEEDIVALKITGRLTKGDFDDLVPSLKKQISASSSPRMIMMIKDFKGWRPTADLWEDLELDGDYIGTFDRIAVVANGKWQQWGTQLVSPITNGVLHIFPPSQEAQAWYWTAQNNQL